MRGGAYVAARQAATLVIGLGGTIALTRLLGPAGYGRFAAALALFIYLASVAQLGINAWLVRRRADDLRDVHATARGLLLLAGLGGLALGALVLPLVERWLGGAGVRWLALGLLGGLPLHLMAMVPLAALERELRYRQVATIELTGMLLMYLVSVALALRGVGPRAMVIGWWAQQLWMLWRLQRESLLPFAFALDRGVAREALRYGLSYASSIWTWQLKDLVNPLIVGRWLGVDGVAIVALAIRLVEAASFVKAAVWRLALPGLSRLQHDPARLAAAVRDGMRLQLALLGPILLALVLVGPRVVPWLFGEAWLATGPILPLIAAGVLANAMFNLHSSALYALARNAWVTLFHVVFVAVFAGVARVLVPLIGVAGYGLAELTALPAYALVFVAFRRAVRSAEAPRPAPQTAELWLGACLVTAVAGSAWSPWFVWVAALPLASAAVRAGLAASVSQARGAFHTRSAA